MRALICGFCCCLGVLGYSLISTDCVAGQNSVVVPTPAAPTLSSPTGTLPLGQMTVRQLPPIKQKMQRTVYDQEQYEETVQRTRMVPRTEEYEVEIPQQEYVWQVPQVQYYYQTVQLPMQVQTATTTCCTGTAQSEVWADAHYRVTNGNMVSANASTQMTALQVAIYQAMRNLREMENDPSVGRLKLCLAKRALARLIRRAKDEGVH